MVVGDWATWSRGCFTSATALKVSGVPPARNLKGGGGGFLAGKQWKPHGRSHHRLKDTNIQKKNRNLTCSVLFVLFCLNGRHRKVPFHWNVGWREGVVILTCTISWLLFENWKCLMHDWKKPDNGLKSQPNACAEKKKSPWYSVAHKEHVFH